MKLMALSTASSPLVKPRKYTSCTSEYVDHERNLMFFFSPVGLVDTESVRPKPPHICGVSQTSQGLVQIYCNKQSRMIVGMVYQVL